MSLFYDMYENYWVGLCFLHVKIGRLEYKKEV